MKSGGKGIQVGIVIVKNMMTVFDMLIMFSFLDMGAGNRDVLSLQKFLMLCTYYQYIFLMCVSMKSRKQRIQTCNS